ncbi:MAG: hypothetical protein IKD96_02655 [Oscillospiraceae bacterium]|nr:hypothetical protein [Oscillospiraceae bacterium]
MPKQTDEGGLNRAADASPQGILENVKAEVEAFVKNAPQFDDLTMLCVEHTGPERERERHEDRDPL